MKKLISNLIALSILFCSFTTFAVTKVDLETISLSDLDETEIMILNAQLYIAITTAKVNGNITGYSSALDIDFSDYTLEQLEILYKRSDEMLEIRKDNPINSDYASIIRSVEYSAKKHFDNRKSVDVSLHGKNLIIRAFGKSNLTTRLIKIGMHIAIYEVMNENRNSPVDFDFLISFPLVDARGNSREEIVRVY